MPRIRTIKPEFWSHPVMGRLDDATRCVALALLNYADDHGFFLADPAAVRSFVRPFDEDSTIVRRALDTLSRIGWISVVEHPSHGAIGRIVNFCEHQAVDRSKPSKLAPYFGVKIDEAKPKRKPRDRRRIDDGSTSDRRSIGAGTGNREQGTGNTAAATHAGACVPAGAAAAAADLSPTPKTEDPDPIADALTRHFPGRSSWLPAARRLAEARGVEKAARAIAEAARAREPVKSFRYVESIAEAQAATNGRPSAAASVEPSGITPELIEQKRRITEQVRRMAAGIGRRA
jgi:hypothetical protein